MKKLFNIALFLGIIGFCNSSFGAANFIVQRNNSGTRIPNVATVNMCEKRGFRLSSCPDGSTPNQRCFASGKTYFDKCCDNNVYRYPSSASCINEGLKPGEKCGARWSCIQP